MKKLIAMLLALMLVLVSVAAMASEGGTGEGGTTGGSTTGGTTEGGGNQEETAKADIDYVKETTYEEDATTPTTVEIDKTFNLNVGANGTIAADTLKFTVGTGVVTEASTVTTAPTVTIDDVVITEASVQQGESTKTYPVTIHLPKFTEVGVYTYPITEAPSKVQGSSNTQGELSLKVTVIRNQTEGANYGKLQVAGIALRTEANKNDTTVATKIDAVENIYEAGSLIVKKSVTGNMGDRAQTWNVTVTFQAEEGKTVNSTIKYTDDDTEKTIAPGWTGTKEASITLVHDESVKFDNIPAGVTYTIVETEANKNGYTTTIPTGTAITANTAPEQVIINNKDITVDTGITLETLPYVMLMALAALGFVALKLRKREEY